MCVCVCVCHCQAVAAASSSSSSKPSSSTSTPSHVSSKSADHTHTNHTPSSSSRINQPPGRRSSRRQQLSAPLNLSITKLSSKRGSSHVQGAGKSSTREATSFQQDVTSFPGGDSMLETLTRLQALNDQLNQQLEVGPHPH